jgi:secreted trypsin-like serine protease
MTLFVILSHVFSRPGSPVLAITLLLLASHPLHADTPGESSQQRISQAIVNGTDAVPMAQPWMAAIVFNSNGNRPLTLLQTCGGTLIAPQWVLTAAHCLVGRATWELSVVIGRDNLDDTGGEIIGISEFIIHPDWQNPGTDADLALLRLNTPSVATVLPLATPALHESKSGTTLSLFGWGNTFDDQRVPCELTLDDGGPNSIGYLCDTLTYQPTNQPVTLQQATLQLHELSGCFDRTIAATGLPDTPENRAQFMQLFSRSTCGWEVQDTQAACFGDSGGPLVMTVDGQAYLVGVVTQILLAGCPLANQITWFVDTSHFSGFIGQSMLRDPALALTAVCPEIVRPGLSYGASVAGRTPVRLQWPGVRGAQQYTLYFSALDGADDLAGSRKFSGDTHEFTAMLSSGDHYLIAMRASSPVCDGPLSGTLELQVP